MAVSPRQLRGLGWSLYCTALLFVASPALEVLATSYPFHPSVPAWRLGVLGLLAQSLPVPVFGVLLALAAAVLLNQRAAQTAVSLLSGLGAAVLLVGWIAFALDVLQLRKGVRPQALASFDMTVSRSALIMLYSAAVLVILTVLGMRGRAAPPRDSEPATLIAGRRTQDTR
jgi:hypothetical protein